MRSFWQRHDALDTHGDTGSASGARFFAVFVAAHSPLSYRAAAHPPTDRTHPR